MHEEQTARWVKLAPDEERPHDGKRLLIHLGQTQSEVIAELHRRLWQLRMAQIVVSELQALISLCQSSAYFRQSLQRLVADSTGRNALQRMLGKHHEPWDKDRLIDHGSNAA